MNVTLICGGPSSEHEVSINSSRSIFEAIDKTKYTVSLLYIDRELNAAFTLLPDTFSIPEGQDLFKPLHIAIETHLKETDICLLAGIHGEFVEDGRLQNMLEYYGIKYTGSESAASSLAMDKYRTSLVVQSLGIVEIPNTILIDLEKELSYEGLEYPLIYKPNTLGSTVGVHIVMSETELKKAILTEKKSGKYRFGLLQEYIQDALELTCGCLQSKDGTFTTLPPVEIIPQKSTFFDYASKYEEGGALEITPPDHIPQEDSDNISQLACDIHELLGCKTYSRSDFLLKDGTLYFMETNTLPGMTKTSLIPKEAAAIGMTFAELINFVIKEAYTDV